MGAASSTHELIKCIDPSREDLLQWVSVFEPLIHQTHDSKELRKKEWFRLDANGTGHVSLAEVSLFIKSKLYNHSKGADRLWALYRPSYIRAFRDASDIQKNTGTKHDNDDDYVTPKEMRMLMLHLCIYAAMYDCFIGIDGETEGVTSEDDQRLSLDEWKVAHKRFLDGNNYGFVALERIKAGESGSVEELFEEIDSNKQGYILLSEWCEREYLRKYEVEAGTFVGKSLSLNDDKNSLNNIVVN